MKQLFFLLMTLLMLLSPALAEETMTLFAVNVGKADALLLHYADALYLIDAGTAQSWGQLSRALETLGVSHLDGVILTHTDKDHAGGLMALATSPVEIDAWYAPCYYEGKESKHPAVLAAEVRRQEVTWLAAGDTLPFGDGSLQVLAPLEASQEENDNSLVLLAESPAGNMLLMGDALETAELRLMETYRLPKVNVLKVGHHGGSDATSDLLIAAVQPQCAVISTSTAERASTPADSVLRLLLRVGAEIAVTQQAQAGILVTLTDGKAEMQLSSWPDAPAMVQGLQLSDLDKENETLLLTNTGSQTIDLTGCYLSSTQGNEIFVLPAGTLIAPGQALTIITLTTDDKGDILWPEKKVWSNDKPDAAVLCDVFGRLLATTD